MRVKRFEVNGGTIFQFIGETQYELTSSFIRMEEFYESPFEEIRGKYFTLDQYKPLYIGTGSSFTYYSDWSGFNIPGDSILHFTKMFPDVNQSEQDILTELKTFIESGDLNFYIIGTVGDVGSLDHECAHAYYYLIPEYKAACNNIYESIPLDGKSQLTYTLIDLGYGMQSVLDEAQAYFSTSDSEYIMDMFQSDDSLSEWIEPTRRRYRELFETYNKKLSQIL